ncbi:MAG: ABC transporter permease [Deltaproteobacteria bacterium]|nr:ABC transporter permease [Deltaproteobacteria bacterium]
MMNILRIASRNLMRYRRRTLLTVSLISLGVMSVLIFVSVAGSFRQMMIGQITDAMLGHVQLHRRGYVASTDSLPLNLNIKAAEAKKIASILEKMPQVEAFSTRIKFGAMLSNYTETSNIRLTAVHPKQEQVTLPLLAGRIKGTEIQSLKRGHLLIPEILARGMKIKAGASVVLVATNRDGSVNGKSFRVAGIVEGLSGPGGRDGYLHIDDARELLRIKGAEITEVAIRIKDSTSLSQVVGALKKTFDVKKTAGKKNAAKKTANKQPDAKTSKGEKPGKLEVHSWRQLSPFSTIAKMIDLLTLFVQIMLVSIVLISVMNVMIMAVYERIREIGSIAAMGVRPRTILRLFLVEGLLLGSVGTIVGIVVSFLTVFALSASGFTFSFGRQQGLLLNPTMEPSTVAIVALGVMVVSALASLQPAIKASRMDPIEALRHV